MENYKLRAPELKHGLDWLNTDKPLTLKELRGKIVILDFWTYCCINCMHVLPDLKRLEEKYKNQLVVIGVHSAKFTTERGTENIRQAILRYDISHPVVNDNNFDIWRQYAVNAWPTLVLIDPNGYIVGSHSGEGIYDIFDYNIDNLIKKHKDDINLAIFNFPLEKNKEKQSFLSFPGKIISDKINNRLIISDSGNNRIIITDTEGNILDIIGNGNKGFKNGNFETTEFNNPQGTVLLDNYLYIADTDNHTIRKADLNNRTVVTIAGLGYQVYSRRPVGKGINMGLNSPWDLTIVNNYLYIAMAGPHQIWKLDLNSNDISVHAGNGAENIVDGYLLNAQLAQPSGLTTDGNVLFFADSEVSAIRIADIIETGKVTTIVGKGLFDFGDKDGNTKNALLQHPIGLIYNQNKIYVADT
ncbi:MAG TPA: thioredoxin-like domain-containing protein, partial [Melioribacteraceae bacterium]|nr:thioredoxin-like domain-containing protein [Melioribacteraceae bacterium]